MPNLDIISILISLPGVLIALSFHEFAHAYTAYLLGDKTASLQGRLSISPFAHLDPIGFICLLFFRFGWAKPVQINPINFKKPRRDTLLVSLAGPLMNFALAIATLIILYFLYYNLGINDNIWTKIAWDIYGINLSLGIFNLIPVPPLDGSKILGTFLPEKLEYAYLYKYQQYSSILLIALLYLGLADYVLNPLMDTVHTTLNYYVGLFF